MTIAEQLRACAQLGDLDATELDILASAVEIVRGETGHLFIREGERGDACYIVLEGGVTVGHAGTDGQPETVLKTLGPGEMFGLVSLIDHGPRSATCRATGKTTLARLEASAFQVLHQGSPVLVLHFQKLVARQLARDARSLNAMLVRAMLSKHAEGAGGESGEFHLSSLG